MEILAPAGNPQALERAIAAGANAVYLGYAAFSARAGAGNFDEPALREAVRLCHLHQVRVHVTVNTLIKDDELPEVLSVLRLLDEIGVDAVLVQDLGVLALARACLPELPIHASTQMAIHHAAGAAWCARMGMSRVVLARECSLQEIRLAADTGIEIEVFGHGAQCVSVSGECLFSSMLGERSGNRGRCAQPCRLTYRYDGQPGAWLSPRDVCLRDALPALAEAGAASIKLEGRLKRPEYVATVTASYANANQALTEGHFTPATEAERESLLQSFQRGGFMTGYALGCEDAGVICPERVDHGGVPIGVVSRVYGHLAQASLTKALHSGDQLRLEGAHPDYEMIYAGETLHPGATASLRLRPDANVRPGDAVVRLVDTAQLEAANALPLPRIPCHATLNAWPGQPLALTVAASGGMACTVQGETVQHAQSRPLTAEAASASLGKTGDTAFVLTGCEVHTENAFVPVSALNALRRDALNLLAETLIESRTRHSTVTLPEPACDLPTAELPDMVIFREPGQLKHVPPEARLIWYPEDFRPAGLESMLSQIPDGCWLALPSVCEQKTLLQLHAFVTAHKSQLGGVLLGSVGQLGLTWPVAIAAGSGIPVMNRRAARLLLDEGCVFVTASPELSGAELRTLMKGQPPIVVPAYGRAQLMLLHHCPARTAQGLKAGHAACTRCDQHLPDSLCGHSLVDRRGVAFPLLRQRLPEGCLVRLMNSLPTDIRSRVQAAGWPMLIELTDEDTLPAGDTSGCTRGHWQRPVA